MGDLPRQFYEKLTRHHFDTNYKVQTHEFYYLEENGKITTEKRKVEKTKKPSSF